MKFLKKCFQFLGSIHFAIALIGTTALFVVAGTFLESKMESHRYAAYFTYSNPVFEGLLWGFFINILFSALRRWPFKLRHIPFLITHLGLLMIFGGLLIKSYDGVQGTMSLVEGSGAQEIFLPDSYSLLVEKREDETPESTKKAYYSLKNHTPRSLLNAHDGNFSDLKIQLLAYTPHSQENLDSWIKQDHARISGLSSFPVNAWDKEQSDSLMSTTTLVNSVPWDFFAIRCDDINAAAYKAYTQAIKIQISDPVTQETLLDVPLAHILNSPFIWDQGTLSAKLQLRYSPQLGWEEAVLSVEGNLTKQERKFRISIPLTGDDALKNQNHLNSYLGGAAVAIDLSGNPSAVFLQDTNRDVYLFAFSAHGEIEVQSFKQNSFHSLIAYDSGFGGYAIQTLMPYGSYASGRKEKEAAVLHHHKRQLRDCLKDSLLSPPLYLFKKACEESKIEFASACLDFLNLWNRHGTWLFPLHASLPDNLKDIFSLLDWNSVASKEKNCCLWTSLLIQKIEPSLQKGEDIMEILKREKWPMLETLQNHAKNPLELITQQIFALGDQLPISEAPSSLPPSSQAHLLSAFMRAYAIHLTQIQGTWETESMEKALHNYYSFLVNSADDPALKKKVEAHLNEEPLCFECPLTHAVYQKPPLQKLEDNLPAVRLKISNGSQEEIIALAYDRYGSGLKWPIFNGKYLVRFQPSFKPLPYRLRLRDARQINYANSTQPYSYEADLLITDLKDNDVVEKTISMNKVHETWDGYRFYLANISPSQETSVQRIQIIVNQDPAKYWLTYPGALMMTLGIILLLWVRPYRQS